MLGNKNYKQLLEELKATEIAEDIIKRTVDNINDSFNVQNSMHRDTLLGEADKKAAKDNVGTGAALWNSVLNAIADKYKSKEALIVKSERDSDYENLFNVDVYEGTRSFRKHKRAKNVTLEELYDLLVSAFVWFSNREAFSSKNQSEEVVIATGEGAVLCGRARAFTHGLVGFHKNTKGVRFISGPIMVSRNNKRVNEFVSEVLSDKGTETPITLYRNKLLAIERLYGGYFHFYVVGDNLLIECPHEFMNDPGKPMYRIVMHDKTLASRFRAFAKNYTEKFASKLEADDQLRNDVRRGKLDRVADFYQYTINEEEEKFDRQGLFHHLKSQASVKQIQQF